MTEHADRTFVPPPTEFVVSLDDAVLSVMSRKDATGEDASKIRRALKDAERQNWQVPEFLRILAEEIVEKHGGSADAYDQQQANTSSENPQ